MSKPKPKPVAEEDCLHCCIGDAINKYAETHGVNFAQAMDALERVVADLIAASDETIDGRSKMAAIFVRNVITELASAEKRTTGTLQ